MGKADAGSEARRPSGLRSVRKSLAKLTGLRHVYKRTAALVGGPRAAARETPRLAAAFPSSAHTLGSANSAEEANSAEDVDRGVDRVMASARHHARRGDAKCAAFCRFADCLDSESRHADSDRRFASPGAFHVFCSVLGCAMKVFGEGEFSVATLRDWRDGAATIPTRVAMDVVANVYNTDAPRDVPLVRESLIRRSEEFTAEGGRELRLDFDFFLSQIMEEYAAGLAPVNPMEAPRRVEGAEHAREGGSSRRGRKPGV